MNKPILLITNNTDIVKNLDLTFNIIGYMGGGTCSICLLPQIIRTIKKKRAKDISYLWQMLSLLGLVFLFSYGIYFMLLPVFIPISLELFLMNFLIALKYYYDNQYKKNKLKELNKEKEKEQEQEQEQEQDKSEIFEL